MEFKVSTESSELRNGYQRARNRVLACLGILICLLATSSGALAARAKSQGASVELPPFASLAWSETPTVFPVLTNPSDHYDSSTTEGQIANEALSFARRNAALVQSAANSARAGKFLLEDAFSTENLPGARIEVNPWVAITVRAGTSGPAKYGYEATVGLWDASGSERISPASSFTLVWLLSGGGPTDPQFVSLLSVDILVPQYHVSPYSLDMKMYQSSAGYERGEVVTADSYPSAGAQIALGRDNCGLPMYWEQAYFQVEQASCPGASPFSRWECLVANAAYADKKNLGAAGCGYQDKLDAHIATTN